MYQTYDDMVEDEYLRKRIRNILGDQVKARGYGNSWNAELGARNYPNENEGGISVGGYGKKSNWTECVSRHKGTKNASKFYDKKTKVCQELQIPVRKRLTAWQQFIRDNSRDENGNSRSMRLLSQMYKSQGGVIVGGDDFEDEHIDLYSLPSVREESDRKRIKAHDYVHGGYGKKSNWTECVSRHKGTKNASKFYDKKTKVCRSSQSQSQTAKRRGLTAWQQFIRDNSRDENGNSRSMKTLSQMYKSRGGVVIPAKLSSIDSGDERYINEGGEYMGGIYLR